MVSTRRRRGRVERLARGSAGNAAAVLPLHELRALLDREGDAERRRLGARGIALFDAQLQGVRGKGLAMTKRDRLAVILWTLIIFGLPTLIILGSASGVWAMID